MSCQEKKHVFNVVKPSSNMKNIYANIFTEFARIIFQCHAGHLFKTFLMKYALNFRSFNFQTEKLQQILASFGIMRVELRALLKPLEHVNTMVSRGLRRVIKQASIMPRGVSLSDSFSKFPGLARRDISCIVHTDK